MNSLLLSVVLPFAFATVFARAETDTPESFASAELPKLLEFYKDLHAHPELSTQEEKTSAMVASELKAAGCEVTDHIGKFDAPGVTGYGVVGLLKNGPGPTVLVRTDMDALPIEEQTGLPYASSVTAKTPDGKDVHVMHACGHDIHMTTFVGVARALSKMKDQWHGTILFVGQPAEETGNGARALLHDGLYTRFPKPDFALGLHDNAELPTGTIGFTEGYACANVDSVDVTVLGVGGHGAYPHKTKDPIVLAAEMVLAWQTIASRENNPLDPVVVTVGSIHGGTKHNIISNEVKMQLTVRTYKAEVRDRVLAAIERIAKGCAVTAGLPADRMPTVKVAQGDFCPAMYNNPELAKRVVAVLKKSLGADKVTPMDPTMGGEDFSEYSLLPDHSIPAFMFGVGAVDPAKVAESKKSGLPLPSLHSSKFAPVPEPTIKTGLVAMTSALLDLLKR
jgi:amidohydrolase